MQRQMAEFDARIAALEASLGVTPSQDEPDQGNSDATASSAAVAAVDGVVYIQIRVPTKPELRGGMGSKGGPNARRFAGFPYEAPLGFVLFADLTGRSTSPQRAK